MKKIIISLMSIILLFTIVGCSTKEYDMEECSNMVDDYIDCNLNVYLDWEEEIIGSIYDKLDDLVKDLGYEKIDKNDIILDDKVEYITQEDLDSAKEVLSEKKKIVKSLDGDKIKYYYENVEDLDEDKKQANIDEVDSNIEMFNEIIKMYEDALKIDISKRSLGKEVEKISTVGDRVRDLINSKSE